MNLGESIERTVYVATEIHFRHFISKGTSYDIYYSVIDLVIKADTKALGHFLEQSIRYD